MEPKPTVEIKHPTDEQLRLIYIFRNKNLLSVNFELVLYFCKKVSNDNVNQNSQIIYSRPNLAISSQLICFLVMADNFCSEIFHCYGALTKTVFSNPI